MMRLVRRPLDVRLHTHNVLHAKLIDAQRSIIAVMAAIEKWEIALGPGAQDFKRVFSDSSTEVQAGFSDLMKVAMPYLPPMQRQPEDDATHEMLEAVLTRAWLSPLAWRSPLDDLRRALQNRMLGGLFKWRVPRREPTDPALRVTELPEE